MITYLRNTILEKKVKSNIQILIIVIKLINKFKFLFLPFETEWKFFKYFKICKNDIILDVGGHLGESIYLYSKYYPQNKIYSFEPINFLYKKIKSNFRNKNIKVFNYGFSNKKEKKIFFPIYKKEPLTLWASTIKKNLIKRLKDYTYLKEFKITSTNVKYKRDFKIKKKVAIIKLDVEGHEHICLKCLKKIILRDKPILFIEHNEINSEMVNNFLKKYTYKCYFFNADNKKILRVNNLNKFEKKLKRSKRALNFIYSTKKLVLKNSFIEIL
jgi:FkbM family methyltransferase